MRPRIADMISIASRLTDVPEADIVGPRRFGHLCAIRAAIYILAKEWGYSSTETGQRFSRRDHSTILHGIKNVERFSSFVLEFGKFCDALGEFSDQLPPFVGETRWEPPRVFHVLRSEIAYLVELRTRCAAAGVGTLGRDALRIGDTIRPSRALRRFAA